MKRTPIKRKTPLRGDPAKVRAWKQKHRKPLRRANAARRAARFKKAYGSAERVRSVQQTPCVVCGIVPTEAAHVRSRGAGGGPDDLVSLCRVHHAEQHTVGTKTFEERHGLNLRAEADKQAERWRAEDG